MDKKLENIIRAYETISLEEAEKVKLFNRSDNKYIFQIQVLYEVLHALKEQYRVLEAGGYVNQPYFSVYYDTAGFNMYLDHHNERPVRYKMRVREYRSTGVSFLEVKQKTSKGQTIKSREIAEVNPDSISPSHDLFIKAKTPFDRENLFPQLTTSFNRITLISKTRSERITLDTNLTFSYQGKVLELPALVIAELKRESSLAYSEFPAQMKLHHIKDLAVSKYCLGLALLHPAIKKNLFKSKIHKVQKLTQTHYHDTL